MHIVKYNLDQSDFEENHNTICKIFELIFEKAPRKFCLSILEVVYEV